MKTRKIPTGGPKTGLAGAAPHPCEVSPYEVLALINAHREVMGEHFATLGIAELRAKRGKGV